MDKKNQGETDAEAEIAAEGAGEKELSLRYENRRQVAKGAYRLVSCRACRPDSDFGGHRLFFGGGTLSRSSRRGAVHFVSRSRHCIVCHRRSCGVLFRQIRARKGKNGKIVKNLS